MFRKVMQMIQDYAEKKLLDEVFATYLDVQDAAVEMAQVLPCPRCGKLTMKMRLHSNALSRQVPGIAICDRCGTEEALEDAVRRPMDVHKWALEDNSEQDFLGELYMCLGLGSDHAGQFFTPYHLCEFMSAVTTPAEEFQQKIGDRGWVAVCDPTCGAGALLVAFANECRKKEINYQTDVLFVAQDIDYIVGMMCYLQMSLLGIAANKSEKISAECASSASANERASRDSAAEARAAEGNTLNYMNRTLDIANQAAGSASSTNFAFGPDADGRFSFFIRRSS